MACQNFRPPGTPHCRNAAPALNFWFALVPSLFHGICTMMTKNGTGIGCHLATRKGHRFQGNSTVFRSSEVSSHFRYRLPFGQVLRGCAKRTPAGLAECLNLPSQPVKRALTVLEERSVQLQQYHPAPARRATRGIRGEESVRFDADVRSGVVSSFGLITRPTSWRRQAASR